jgi:hypothetical protein
LIVLRLERAIYLSLAILAVVVYWRSIGFVYGWLPIVYCSGPTQAFFDWYSLMAISPLIPFVGMIVALLLARLGVLMVVRTIVAATSTIAGFVIARIFSEMMMPLAWGDCVCCGGPAPSGPREMQPPLILRFSPSARSAFAVGALVVMSLVALAILIAEFRIKDRRVARVAMTAASLAIFFCAGWILARAPGFVWWTDGWRYVALMCGMGATACLAGSVSIVRKSIGASVPAVIFVALSYVVIYRAVDFFAMIAR